MTTRFAELPAGITRIDVEYTRPGFAAAWLIREGQEAAFVETGPLPSVPILLEALSRHGLGLEAVRAVIVTHVHLDHAGAAGELMRHLPNATLYLHAQGVKHLVDPTRLVDGAKVVYGEEKFLATLGGATPVDPARIHTPTDGTTLDLAGRRLTFIETPGHSLNHFCILDHGSNGLFTGDAFGLSYREFDGGQRPLIIPATTPTQFDIEHSRLSIQRLAALRPDWLYLTHFGPLPFDPALAADLDEQLVAYRELAEQSDPPAGSATYIPALLDLTQTLGQKIGLPATTEWSILAMDLDLNAQGLAIWRERMSRRTAG
ncbi:MAG: MBL fold metallo-hydrolase [Magnetococcales bacterium]|nr:MBL fold metallo-hydrolase [Magnetococcales bacterium]NGZ05097.1 MBL fold metallo-hydrolase [Magnetococcales bacterium]